MASLSSLLDPRPLPPAFRLAARLREEMAEWPHAGPEGDERPEPPHDRPGAEASGGLVRVWYWSWPFRWDLAREEAADYLRWLEEGHVGPHWRRPTVPPPPPMPAAAAPRRRGGALPPAYRVDPAEYLRLADFWADRYPRSVLPREDRVAAAREGLCRAALRYDPDRGVPFGAYAHQWIRTTLVRAILRALRVGRYGGLKLFPALLRAARAARVEGGTADLERALEPLLGLEPLWRRAAAVHCLDGPELRLDASSDDGETLIDRLTDPDAVGPEQWASFGELLEQVRALGLSGREEEILRERLTGADESTLASLGARWGVSRERARQLEARLLPRLRGALRAWREGGEGTAPASPASVRSPAPPPGLTAAQAGKVLGRSADWVRRHAARQGLLRVDPGPSPGCVTDGRGARYLVASVEAARARLSAPVDALGRPALPEGDAWITADEAGRILGCDPRWVGRRAGVVAQKVGPGRAPQYRREEVRAAVARIEAVRARAAEAQPAVGPAASGRRAGNGRR